LVVKGWRRVALAEKPAPSVVAPADPSVANLAWEVGDQFCSARGCTQKTGLACSYIDRRQRPCPTAWCPQHRHVTHGAVFCPAHGGFLVGAQDEFRETVHVDLGNAVPAVLAWVVQEIDDEISSAMLYVAMEWHQALVLDPVHFGLVGVHRVRTWERSWKVCDSLGPTLRVSVVIEEARPDVLQARMNAQPLIDLPIPWHESHGFGAPPATREEAKARAFDFRQRLLAALIRGIADWRRDNLGNREPVEASLRGVAWQADARASDGLAQ
jgi:hypothetical protein